MRSFTALTIISLLSAAVTSFAAPTFVTRDGELTEMAAGPTDLSLQVGDGSIVPTPVKRLTNAERFSRGMQPAAPRRFNHARNPQPSLNPTVTRRGKVQVSDTDGNILGYIAKASFSNAQHRYLPSVDDALIVRYTVAEGTTSASQLDFTTENSDMNPAAPFLGLVQGRDSTSSDISVGNNNYGYFAGTAHTDPGATPATTTNSYTTVTKTERTSESPVWSITGDDKLSVQWINTDGSAPKTDIFTQGTALYFGGDAGAFASKYPSPVKSITLKFIAI